ncbi:MAG: hypothetical protein ACLGSD_15245 [Acidobacteriota bacterium]
MPASPDIASPSIEDDIEAVFRLYLGLAHSAQGDDLGGQLLYAGSPDAAGCHLLRAANIAGAASLASAADATLLRHAMHAGAIDFVVNSLDEALRILKNEIRKHQPVAVGVSVVQEALLREMNERGVQPDLLAPELPDSPAIEAFAVRGARRVQPQGPPQGSSLKLIPIPPDWKQPAAAFDALLIECLAPEDTINRRWVRFAPRYLPSAARRLRSLACNSDTLSCLSARMNATSTWRPAL